MPNKFAYKSNSLDETVICNWNQVGFEMRSYFLGIFFGFGMGTIYILGAYLYYIVSFMLNTE